MYELIERKNGRVKYVIKEGKKIIASGDVEEKNAPQELEGKK